MNHLVMVMCARRWCVVVGIVARNWRGGVGGFGSAAAKLLNDSADKAARRKSKRFNFMADKNA
jgi:hypothetical protein